MSIPEGTKPDDCRKCGAPVFWVDSESVDRGRVMLDEEPSRAGRYVLEPGVRGRPVAKFLDRDAAASYGGTKYDSHYHTCPERRRDRASHREADAKRA